MLPWDYANCDFALWKKRDAVMCGNARVTGSHASTPDGRLDIQISSSARLLACVRDAVNPLIMAGENHTSQSPVAILNATVIANRLSLDDNSWGPPVNPSGRPAPEKETLFSSIVTETERSDRRCLRRRRLRKPGLHGNVTKCEIMLIYCARALDVCVSDLSIAWRHS